MASNSNIFFITYSDFQVLSPSETYFFLAKKVGKRQGSCHFLTPACQITFEQKAGSQSIQKPKQNKLIVKICS